MRPGHTGPPNAGRRCRFFRLGASPDDPVPAERWDRELPGLVFVPVPEVKTSKNRLHLDLAAHREDDGDAEIARLLDLGATQIDVGQEGGRDLDGPRRSRRNEFCVLSKRER